MGTSCAEITDVSEVDMVIEVPMDDSEMDRVIVDPMEDTVVSQQSTVISPSVPIRHTSRADILDGSEADMVIEVPALVPQFVDVPVPPIMPVDTDYGDVIELL